MKVLKYYFLVSAVLFFTVSCSELLPPEPESETVLAAPIDELTPQQFKNHLVGDNEFGRIFGEQDGLGPTFVSNSCETCHVGDGKGHPLTTLTRFGRYNNNIWDPMISHGGPQLQNRAVAGYSAEQIPGEATGVTRLMPPAVTGLGYLAAVTDAAILAMADPNDSNGDGISGVPNYVLPPDYFEPLPSHKPLNGKYIGRFGRKAGAVDLLNQVVNAYIEDMGVTSDFRIRDNFNFQSGLFTGDNVDDPEVSATVVNNVVFYIRTLKAPPRRDKDNPDITNGEKIFKQINCSGCHVPALITGPSDIEALSNKTFYPYTDLLLHDMGNELDDNYVSAVPSV